MPVTPARRAAYRILRRVESGRAFAVDLLQSPLVAELKEVDRRLTTELVMGVLRWGGGLDFEIQKLSRMPLKYFDPEVATILRLGIYQIRFLKKIPKPAVVNEAVEMTKAARKRSATSLVNAVLRKCEPPVHPIAAEDLLERDPESVEMACRSVPAWLFERWTRLFGSEAAKGLARQSVKIPCTTLRVTGATSDREEIRRELSAQGVRTRPGRYRRQALVVESGDLHSAKAFREGRVMIQDEASQLVADLVRAEPGNSVLDLCAAPGIKTGQLAEALGTGTLVACELSVRRLQTMSKLLPKAVPEGLRFGLVRLDATRELSIGRKFDRILVDVPCSGTGTLARNPEIKGRLEAKDFLRLAGSQVKMLRNALDVLAPRGRVVYATCSLEPEENEQVVEKVLYESPGCRLVSAEELSEEFPALYRFFDSVGYFRTRPDLHSMDGFFAAVIVRGS